MEAIPKASVFILAAAVPLEVLRQEPEGEMPKSTAQPGPHHREMCGLASCHTNKNWRQLTCNKEGDHVLGASMLWASGSLPEGNSREHVVKKLLTSWLEDKGKGQDTTILLESSPLP